MQSGTIDRQTLLNITLFVESLILLTATFWTYAAKIQLLEAMRPEPQYIFLGIAGGCALALVSFLALWLGKSIGILSDLREITFSQVAPLFNSLQPLDIFLVAAVSGFCEEVFFRGVLQAQLGIWFSSAIFAFFHCPNLRFISYGFWVFGAGLFLGWLYMLSGNLWIAIMAHATSNLISLFFLRYAPKPPSSTAE